MLRSYFKKVSDYIEQHPLHPLHKTALGILFLLVGITFVQSNLFDLVQRHADTMLSAVLPSVIIELTNEERAEAAVPALKRNQLLDESARRKAEDMVKNEYFAHDSPSGIDPWYWFDDVGYDYVHAGENLAIYFEDSEDVVEAWMESPLHRANIMDDKYTEIGVAAVKGVYEGYDTVFIVQHFGTPAQATTRKVAEVVPLPQVQVAATEEEVEVTPLQEVAEEETPVIEEVDVKPEIIKTEIVTYAEDHNGTTVYVSDHDSTSTDKLPATTTPVFLTAEKTYIPPGPTATTENMLAIAYLILLIIGAGTIVATIVIGVRHNHHHHAYYGASLFILLIGVTLLHTAVL